MTRVYLDTMGHLWSADRDELHALAARIGMKPEWFQERPRLYHYDLMTRTKRDAAVRAGAQVCSPRRLIALIHEAECGDEDACNPLDFTPAPIEGSER